MLRFYPREVFKEIFLENKLQFRYAISNFGRFVRFTDKIEEGNFIQGGRQNGHKIWRYTVRDENNKVLYKYRFFHKLVAEYFIPKTSDEQVYVLHLNYDKTNDYVGNLRWATHAEMVAHNKKSPLVIEYRKKQAEGFKETPLRHKLTSTQVRLLKKLLLDPNRKTRVKILARQFGVTAAQLNRIKTGKRWGHI